MEQNGNKKFFGRRTRNLVLGGMLLAGALGTAGTVFGVDLAHIVSHASIADRTPEWHTHAWMTNSPYAPEFEVLDTESALGRYAQTTKTITIKDMVKFHGHACDGLIMAAGGIKLALNELFPEGKIDRTDLRILTKNGPCFVDVSGYLTGGRINFGTLDIDNKLGRSWVVQRISTGKTVKSGLRPGVFPEKLDALENKIRAGQGTPAEITQCRDMAWIFARDLLSKPLEKSFVVEEVKDFTYPASVYGNVGKRGDIVQKNAPLI